MLTARGKLVVSVLRQLQIGKREDGGEESLEPKVVAELLHTEGASSSLGPGQGPP